MVSDLNIFVWKWSKIAKQKKMFFFLADFVLQNSVETTLFDGLETSGQRVYRKFWHISRLFCVFWMIFSVFFFKLGFWVVLVYLETTLPDGLDTSGQRAYRKFWHSSRRFWVFAFWMIFSVFQKILFWGILGPPSYGIGATFRTGREMLCLLYAGFLNDKNGFLYNLSGVCQKKDF